jgi:CheY-like chemotaxis protein
MAYADRKILCIEDDRETAGLIAEGLADRGFRVSLARSGQEGLMAIMRATPHLVLCDVSMSHMTGFEVLERLNEIAPGSGTYPVRVFNCLDRSGQRTARAAAGCR